MPLPASFLALLCAGQLASGPAASAASDAATGAAGEALAPSDGGGAATNSLRPDEPGSVARDVVEGGTHWRLMTASGAIHVWRPRGYEPRTAGTLLYVHGYYSDADETWRLHGLAPQFRESRRNALFVVPESPVSNPDRVRWEDPVALLKQVSEQLELPLPPGPVVAMGHSGGIRTIVPWLLSPRIDEVILLDGFYASENDFSNWLKADLNRSRRLVLVGFETVERTEQFLAAFSDALIRDTVPATFAEFHRRERRAQVLYLRSQYAHMELVTEGKVIPMLVKLSSFRPI